MGPMGAVCAPGRNNLMDGNDNDNYLSAWEPQKKYMMIEVPETLN
jgi:hypothetical protein